VQFFVRLAQQFFKACGYEVTPSDHAEAFLAHRRKRMGIVSVIGVMVDSVERTIHTVLEEVHQLERYAQLVDGCVVLPRDAAFADRLQVESARLRPIAADDLRQINVDDLEGLVRRQLAGLEANVELSCAEGAPRVDLSRVASAYRKFLRSEQERVLVVAGVAEAVAEAWHSVALGCATGFLQGVSRYAPILLPLGEDSPRTLEQLTSRVFAAHGVWHNHYDLRRLLDQEYLLPLFHGLVSPLRRVHPLDLVRQALGERDERARAVLFLSGDTSMQAEEIGRGLDLPRSAVYVHSLSGDAGAGGVELFLLATREDHNRFFEPLAKHLAPLRRRGVRVFNPYRLLAGTPVHRQSIAALERVQIVVLLVSHHLLDASGDVEEWVELALAAQRQGRVVLVPVIVGTCAWRNEPYRELEALPRGKGRECKPVDTWTRPDQAWVTVVEDLEAIIQEKFSDLLRP
jgi:hypothetical protein